MTDLLTNRMTPFQRIEAMVELYQTLPGEFGPQVGEQEAEAIARDILADLCDWMEAMELDVQKMLRWAGKGWADARAADRINAAD